MPPASVQSSGPGSLGELAPRRIAQHLREALQRPLRALRLGDQLAHDLAVHGHAVELLLDAAGAFERDLEDVLGIARLIAEQHHLAGEVVGLEPAASAPSPIATVGRPLRQAGKLSRNW